MKLILGLILIISSVWLLESARSDLEISSFQVGETPVTLFEKANANGPAVVMAHGFAGSSQMMQGYALPLARAGYRVYAFDFLGHGRHPLPMSGDVTSVDGTTRLLVEQTERIIDAIGAERIALVGHSMATDVLVRVAERRSDVGPLVLLSAFSEEIDGKVPQDLLLIVGSWEAGLRDFALRAVRMVDPDAGENTTVVAGQIIRRAAVAPMTEHVSILQSTTGREEAQLWLDRSFGRTSSVNVLPTGPAIVALLAGLVLTTIWVAGRLPRRTVPAANLSTRQLFAIIGTPIAVAPPLAILLNPGIVPVLVADHLALHLAIYGGFQLGLLLTWRVPLGPFSSLGFVVLLIGCGAFGLALDRYAANFLPTGNRLWIIALMAVGSVLFFIADARLTHGLSFLRRASIHFAFLLSLLVAVALDFEGLFFLMMIAPVIVLFYLAFGTMGHAVSNRTGPLAPGVALGLVLAWSLGVSFPLFQG